MSADGAPLTTIHSIQASDFFQRGASQDAEQVFSSATEAVHVVKKQPNQSDSPFRSHYCVTHSV